MYEPLMHQPDESVSCSLNEWNIKLSQIKVYILNVKTSILASELACQFITIKIMICLQFWYIALHTSHDSPPMVTKLNAYDRFWCG